jgi:phage repressor protein C with HTH and peptisase S24 domain
MVMKVGEKIAAVRKSRGFSQGKLAKTLGWSPSNLARIETGRVSPSIKTLESIASCLEVSSSCFLEKSPLSSEIAVIAFASAGEAVSFTDLGYPQGGGMYYIDRPPLFTDPNGFGVEVSGDSMVPKYEDGQVVLVDTRRKPSSGDFAVIGLISGDKYVKRYRETQGVVILESVNTLYPPIVVHKEDISFAYKIVWAKER